MHLWNRLLFLFCISISLSGYAAQKKLFIIIHGTWAHTMAGEYPWFVPGGSFFDALEKSAQEQQAKVITWQWSGSAWHKDRVSAARQLRKIIQSYPINTEIHIVAHSFGTSIAALATHLMAEDPNNKHTIAVIYGLGCPIVTKNYLSNAELYIPNMQITRYFYNFFSFHDLHQAGFGTFEREIDTHERILNIRTMINGIPADHYSLHNAVIGKWVPYIHEQVLLSIVHNMQQPLQVAGLIFFSKDNLPTYEQDYFREILRQWDKKNHQKFWKSYVRRLALYNPPQFPLSPTNWHPEKLKDFITYNISYACKKIAACGKYVKTLVTQKAS